MEVCFTGDAADFFRIFRAEVASDFGIDVAQHRICAKGAHACTVNLFDICFEPGLHHSLRGVTVGHADTLAKAIIERIVQVKDHATDDRLHTRARLSLFLLGEETEFFLFLFFLVWAGSGISPDTAISILITATIQKWRQSCCTSHGW